MADRVALIDYGAGNLHSVHNALKAAGAGNVAVTDDPATVRAADRIVLPGVGAFAACMNGLSAIPGMIDALEDRVQGDKVPFLGICVGMQLLAERGLEHGTHAGLGWIGGEVRAMEATPSIKVPHMGWNDVRPSDRVPLIVPGEAYFLHSYHFAAADAADVAAVTDHGGPVTAAVARGNILGVQFHPEKSQAYGLDLLRRFLDWTVS
ncbi:imidazole glycerol phosphate synthase subunit HisH [Sphingomonas ursincola]|uniref:imidazole glycerol phosphate synthase subunit HisH n=1 Tax=Sphingomonas ursincola TaxID=56361 RepID=UPI002357070D|nr:imidazole glycerol phosphate synthase subunit HisH [Sphingomonas ursincola]MBY0620948.1 imidazole glycerol phosphate synthase subunit HisH [Sphingomonas ursincola]